MASTGARSAGASGGGNVTGARTGAYVPGRNQGRSQRCSTRAARALGAPRPRSPAACLFSVSEARRHPPEERLADYSGRFAPASSRSLATAPRSSASWQLGATTGAVGLDRSEAISQDVYPASPGCQGEEHALAWTTPRFKVGPHDRASFGETDRGPGRVGTPEHRDVASPGHPSRGCCAAVVAPTPGGSASLLREG